MVIKLNVQTLDGIPEELHEHYKKQEDGSYLVEWESEGGYSIDKVGGLKSALQTIKEEKRALQEFREKFGDVDPEKAREAMEKIAEYEGFDGETKVKEAVEARLAQIETKHTQTVDGLKGRNDILTRELKKKMVDEEIAKHVARQGCTGARAEALTAKIRQEIQAEETDGVFKVFVQSADGQRRITLRTDSNDYMTVEERVTELKSDKDWGDFFEAPKAAGVQSDTGGGGDAASRGDGWDKLSATEKLKAAHRQQA